MRESEPVIERVILSTAKVLKENPDKLSMLDPNTPIVTYLAGILTGMTTCYLLFKAQYESDELKRQWDITSSDDNNEQLP